jgi:hypothetical protein
MKRHELTCGNLPATSAIMLKRGDRVMGTSRLLTALVVGTGMLGGCISVNAPDKPIVIELNINIKQEVVYRIAKDVENTIEENPEIF